MPNPRRYSRGTRSGGAFSRRRRVPRVKISDRGQYKFTRRRYKDHGDYTVDNGPMANLGSRVGEWVGRRLGYYGSRWFGGSGSYRVPRRTFANHGDYNISGLPDGGEKVMPAPPRFSVGADGAIYIEHREYIQDIITSSSAGAFKCDRFSINPGDPACFPWLSTLVPESYQQFELSGCIFEFRSFSASALNSTNTALGAVFAAINYDWNDPDFTTRAQVENSDWSMSAKPDTTFIIPVECKRNITAMGGVLYVVNNGSVPSGADPKLYYAGKLNICTQGFQAASVNIGSLYVTYKIKLMKPIMTPPCSSSLLYSAITNTPSGNIVGSSPYVIQADTIGVVLGSNTITLKGKRLSTGQTFMFSLISQGSSTASVVGPSLALTNATSTAGQVSLLLGASGNGQTFASAYYVSPTTGTTAGTIIVNGIFTVLVGGTDVVLTFSGQTVPSSATTSVSIFAINSVPASQLGSLSTTAGVVSIP